MYHGGDFLGQAALKYSAAGILTVLGDEGFDFLAGEGSEDFDVFLGIVVGDIEPELVELVGRCVAAVEPYVAAFSLAEFAAVGLW